MIMKKRMLSLALGFTMLATAALSGCAGGTNQSSEDNSSKEPELGGSVVVGVQQDIDSLDPHKATAAGTKEILFNIFEGLVKPDENGNLINAVASDYTVSDDGLVYTFTIRDGIKFHNGNAVTVNDVKYSLERASGLLDGKALVGALKKIKSVEIASDKSVKVTVSSASAEFIYNMTVAIIPEGSGGQEASQPVGTGPFKFVSYTPQQSIVVEKNADYWQAGLPYLDQVTFKIVTSSDTALLELQGGSIDIYPYLTDSQKSEVESLFNVKSATSDVLQALFFNNAVEPLNNVKVRQAINYALDKDAINGFVAGGTGVPISSAMLPTLKNYYVDLNSTYGNTANTEKAKQLLSEAGYPNGFDLTITVPSSYEFHMETAEVVVEQLKAVGINAKIDAVEWSSWLSDVYNGRNYQSTICGITCDLTPSYLLNRFVSDASKNFVNFNSEKYDAVYSKILTTVNQSEVDGYYKELQKILCDEAGSAFIQACPLTIAINKKLAGYKFYPVYVQDMSTVYYTK